MDEIKQRLTETSEACIKTYEVWREKNQDASAREALQEAVHELRKVAARLEIELAVSDRKSHGSEPIPIPSHRASRRPAQTPEGGEAVMEDTRPRGGAGGQQGFGGGARRPAHNNLRRSPSSEGLGQQASSAPAPSAAPVAAEAGNEAAAPAAGGDDDGQRKPRPLSLRRGSPEGEQQG